MHRCNKKGDKRMIGSIKDLEGIEKPQLYNVLLIDTEKDAPQIIRTGGGLSEWYRLIKCDLIDIQEHYIDGHAYDFIIDDEALLKAGGKVSALDKDGNPCLVGNIVICTCDEEGNESGLSDEDIQRILKHVVILQLTKPIEGRATHYAAIAGIEY